MYFYLTECTTVNNPGKDPTHTYRGITAPRHSPPFTSKLLVRGIVAHPAIRPRPGALNTESRAGSRNSRVPLLGILGPELIPIPPRLCALLETLDRRSGPLPNHLVSVV